jgi:glycosyltransferase involved in cell wall biosynthesis
VTVDLDWSASRNEHAIAAGLGRPTGRWQRRRRRFSNRLQSARRRPPDVYHPTWYYPDRLPTVPGPPMVVTVVDMIPELMPDLFSSGAQHLAKEAFVRQASAVVCISESTRRDLLRLLGPLEAVVEVVPLAVGANFRPGQRSARPLPDDYLLFVGNRGTYKDFAVALESFAGVRAGHPGLSLVAVGGGQFTQAELDAFRRLSIEGSVHRVDASDDELPALFGRSRAFVFPSRYEGFGLPTLEAMASGTPVILADSSSHPEVGGDVALYFPPGDAAALSAQVLRVLGDVELARSLVARGIERAAGFTWRQTAARTRDVYEAVARPG